MINSLNLYKLLVGKTIPKCVDCVHFKPGVITEGYCKVFGNILQIFYNYIVSKIDGIVNKMEDSSIGLLDIMTENNIFKK